MSPGLPGSRDGARRNSSRAELAALELSNASGAVLVRTGSGRETTENISTTAAARPIRRGAL